MATAASTPPPRRQPLLEPGDPAPWFRAPALGGNPDYNFNTVAGRHVLLLLYGSAGHPRTRAALDAALARRALFDDDRCSFFGVSTDPADLMQQRISPVLPGIRHLIDKDGAISARFGASDPAEPAKYLPHWLLLDPTLQVVRRFALDESAEALEAVAALPIPLASSSEEWAPVLSVERVFEPALCRHLIDLYEAHGGTASGFMREVDGKTVQLHDASHKRRKDWVVDDPKLREELAIRIRRRLRPLIHRAFQFDATRMERYLVGCYSAEGGGFFRPHRDNTTGGTAHRRFAVTINLNAGEYDGGDLRFPEYGRRAYRAATGGAIVFSCSLLHEATPVTRGRRYAFLPFLYDDAAARQREENNAKLGDGVGQYRA